MKFNTAVHYLRKVIEELKRQRKKYSREDKESVSEEIKSIERAIIELRNHEK